MWHLSEEQLSGIILRYSVFKTITAYSAVHHTFYDQDPIIWSVQLTYSCHGDYTDLFIFRINFPQIQTPNQSLALHNFSLAIFLRKSTKETKWWRDSRNPLMVAQAQIVARNLKGIQIVEGGSNLKPA